MRPRIILGRGFGDEGKGLAVDHFARQAESEGRPCLVVRFNGGAQAGHTVDLPDGRRFVFHQLSSGSFRGADTLWADAFLPDLYKLQEELDAFRALHRREPRLFAFGGCRCVIPDDVLLNMALERSRGAARHGSCGMGINEAVQRSAQPEFRLTLTEVLGMGAGSLAARLSRLREGRSLPRLRELGLSPDRIGEFGELLQNENVLRNAAEEMCRGADRIRLIRPEAARTYDALILEGAQGLLLDENCTAFAPHLTSSRTGLFHPLQLRTLLFPREVPEVVYVTRTYVTRHGAGPLPHEAGFDPLRRALHDRTNLPNEWQGSLRYACHGAPEEFLAPILGDLAGSGLEPSLMLTHLDETGGRVCTVLGDLPLAQWLDRYEIRRRFERVYLSPTPFSEDVRPLDPAEPLAATHY